jgi:glycerol-3-phosphate dehydrogenase
VANRCAAIGIVKGDGVSSAVTGVEVEADGRRFTIDTRSVVNAAGVWSDDVRQLDEGAHPDSIRPAKGVHLAVPWEKVRNDIAVVIPVPKDRRSLFVVPWGRLPDGTYQHTYVGTTDTDYDGPLDDPQCTANDVTYVLDALNATVTTGITEADVTGVWAGLRPLVKSASSGRTADLSRRHKVSRSPSGMVSVTGGKLTTYREMASDTVDEIMRVLGRSGRSQTKRLKLLGAEGYKAPPVGSPEAHLAGRYGTLASEVQALIADDPSLGEPLVEGLAYLKAEAVYAVRHEMATTIDDVLDRRTRARLFDREESVAAAASLVHVMAPELGWDADDSARQLADYHAAVALQMAAEHAPGEVPTAGAATADAGAQVPPAGAGGGE